VNAQDKPVCTGGANCIRSIAASALLLAETFLSDGDSRPMVSSQTVSAITLVIVAFVAAAFFYKKKEEYKVEPKISYAESTINEPLIGADVSQKQ